jgi:hypothetical protein
MLWLAQLGYFIEMLLAATPVFEKMLYFQGFGIGLRPFRPAALSVNLLF